ncbi:MAG: hypothetical protein II689_04555, partial [Firmicutes bacterium]|nr:hypothetical protein [Bacillota bacterium]
MKKLIALLLALAMLLSVAACGKKQTPAEPEISENTEPEPVEEPVEDPAVPLPSVGDKVEGFTAKELRDFPLVGATIVRFEHDRTGAQLVYIANSDTNRVFDLTFFTRAVDNTGIP